MSRKALGKGIRAIIPEQTQEQLSAAMPVPIDEVRPNPYQPRQAVEEDLSELVASIKEKGVLQPVVVRRRRDGYELVMGERRLRAAKLAGLDRIPAVVRPVEDGEMLELALVENVQRANLNPIEEAAAYRRLADEFGLNQEEIAARVGRDRSTVANALRLLTLPRAVREALVGRQITAGHARALLQLQTRREQVEICEKIVREGLSVRAAEKLCAERRPKQVRPQKERDPHVVELEESLQERLGTKVHITEPGKGPGRIAIEFFSAEDLERIVRIIRPA